jgi:hypothetical protein
MKWSNRSAQGFSPGWSEPRIALKVATEWGRLFQHDHPKLSHRSKQPALIQHHTFGRHFQGDLGVLLHPGLKPWADLLDHFMVKPGPDEHDGTANRQLLTANR